jgi:hypothetical protein
MESFNSWFWRGQNELISCTWTQPDGRGTWFSLKAHFEGEGFHKRNVEDAYSKLESIT